MLSTKSSLCLMVLCLTAFSFLPNKDQGKRAQEVADRFLQEHKKDMKSLFGKAHLSLNHNSTYVSQVQPFIWGNDNVILMLEVKHFGNNCSISRNVVFLLDTGSPFTYISPALRRLILDDCKIDLKTQYTSIGIKINGRQIYPLISKDYYADASILGMDYMKANNIEFSMKINRFLLGKSIFELQVCRIGRDNRSMIYRAILIQPFISIQSNIYIASFQWLRKSVVTYSCCFFSDGFKKYTEYIIMLKMIGQYVTLMSEKLRDLSVSLRAPMHQKASPANTFLMILFIVTEIY